MAAADLRTPGATRSGGTTGAGRGPDGVGGRLASLDGMRAVAALAILVAHVGFLSGENFRGGIGPLYARLDVGMPIFFVISGFVVYRPFLRRALAGRPPPDVGRYLRRRVARIVPLYWLALLITQIVSRDRLPLGRLISAILLVHIHVPGFLPPLLEQSWSLCVEVAFYLAVPILARLGGRTIRGQARLLVLMAGAAWAFRIGVGLGGLEEHHPVFNWFPNFGDTFAVGMGLALLVERRAQQPPAADRPDREGAATAGSPGAAWACWAAAAAVMAILAFGAGLPTNTIRYTTSQHLVLHAGYTAVAGLLVAPLVLGWPGRSPASLLATRPMRVLGALSFGIYLWQNLAMELIVRRYPEQWRTVSGGFFGGPFRPLLLWTVVVTVLMALVTFVLVERPALRRAASAALDALPTGTSLALGTVTAGAFLFRFWTLGGVSSVRPTGGDPFYYHAQANMLADGLGFGEPFRYVATGELVPTAIHPPAFSVVLSMISRVGGRDFLDHKMVACLLGAAAVLVVGLIARRIAGDTAGVVAAVLAAAYPSFWLVDGILMPEGMFILTCALAILAAYRWRDRPRPALAAGLGALIAVAALTRGEGVLLSVLLVVPWFWFHRTLATRRRVRHIAAAAAGCAVVLAPWMIRNAVTFEENVPLSTNGMEVIMYANCPESYRGEYAGYWFFECQERIRRERGEFPGDESERAKAWQDLGWRYARDNIDRLPAVMAIRVGRIWELYRPAQNAQLSTIEGRNLRSQQVGLAMYYPLAALAVAGFVMARRRGIATWPLTVQVVCVTLTALYAYGADRFRAPAEITIVVLSAAAIGWWWDRRIRGAVPDASRHESGDSAHGPPSRS